MKLTVRERRLVAGAIPLLLGLGYWGVLRPVFERRAETARASIAAAGSTEAGELERETLALRAEVADLDARAAACMERESRLLADWPRADRRSAAAARLGELVRTGGARVEAARVADASEVVLGKEHRTLERLARGLGAAPPVVWRLDFRADYAALTSALENLADSDAALVPVALRAEPDGGFERLSCTLWAWL